VSDLVKAASPLKFLNQSNPKSTFLFQIIYFDDYNLSETRIAHTSTNIFSALSKVFKEQVFEISAKSS